jgi:cytochrome c553
MRNLAFAVVALVLSFPAQASDANNGKELVKAKGCIACHGEMGEKPSAADQPILAGQYNDYLVRALSDYKSGRRTNPIMKGMAGQLSKQDIEDLAAWFSSQKKTTLHNQR